MIIFRSAGQGFKLTFKLWPVVLLYLVAYSAVGALATVLIPHEIVNNQVRVPPPANFGDALSQLVIGLALYLPTMAFSLYLLGGTLAASLKLVGGEPVPMEEFHRQAKRLFGVILRWGLAAVGAALAAGLVVTFLMTLLWALTGRSEGMKGLIGAGFWGAMLAAGLLLIYSPVILIERGQGIKEAFKESNRFFNKHRGATFGLILWLSFIGALIWLVWAIGVAPVVKVVREMAGLPPFPKGLPNFFFSLVLGLPSAFLSVYFPLALGIFYRGRNGDTGTGA
ncbi:MAG: hypothetical protein Q7J69_05520 [Candidatus Omnitrophota bacterium]|nr:hypothetical protein [Candidatus Omnitrophota bacterium]